MFTNSTCSVCNNEFENILTMYATVCDNCEGA